jgi:hypothetical protein
MDDGGDLHEQILHIEANIKELTDVIERCRKIILISKAAVAAGGTVILAIIIGAVGFDPTVMTGAIAAVIGGTVIFGSNTSTLKQIRTDVKAAEAHRGRVNQQNASSGGGRREDSRVERGGIIGQDAHLKARAGLAIGDRISQYSSASMIVITRSVTVGSDGSGE